MFWLRRYNMYVVHILTFHFNSAFTQSVLIRLFIGLGYRAYAALESKKERDCA